MLVLGLDENLLSVGQMMQHGYFLLFGDDRVAIFEDRSLESHVVTIQMTGNRCFPLLMKDMNGSALKASIEGDAWEWHKRLGHLNFNILQLLSDKEMVLSLPKLKKSTGVCKWCIAGKQHRDAFNKELTWRASKPL
ncbi:hypothetical protein ACFX11_031293 [Malus domestica]